MKKFLMLILAVTMVMSLAMVSNAANIHEIDFSDFEFEPVPSGSEDEAYIAKYVVPYPYRFEKDYNMIETDHIPKYWEYTDDNTAYYAIVNKDLQLINKADACEGISVKAEWELGGEVVQDISVVRKKTDREVFAYFLAIKFKHNNTQQYQDIVGTVTLRKNTGDFRFGKNSNGKREIKVAVEFDTRYVLAYEARNNTYINDASYIHKFNKVEDPYECEFTFEDWEDATFTVQVNDQDPLILKVTDDFSEDVAINYDLCNLDFFNGNGASFNHRGTLFLPSEYGRFVYERNGTTLKPVPNVVYDEKDEGFYIKTRTLGNYVISDRDIDIYSEAGVIYTSSSDVED